MKRKQNYVVIIIIILILLSINFIVFHEYNSINTQKRSNNHIIDTNNEQIEIINYQNNEIDKIITKENEKKEIYIENQQDGENKTIIFFASIFVGKKDPQRPDNESYKDCFNYFKNWYQSIHNLGLEAIVFYDDLSDEFTKKYTTNNVKFQLVSADRIHPNLYPAESRFLAFNDFVQNSSKKWDYVMITDISDVVFNRNPLEFMIEYPEKDLFLSFEDEPVLIWVRNKWRECYRSKFPEYYKINAAGMWGGKWGAVETHLHLLSRSLIPIADKKNPPGVCDMIAHIRITNEYWNTPEIRSRVWDEGQPLFNKIKTARGTPGEPEDVLAQYYIVHNANITHACPEK